MAWALVLGPAWAMMACMMAFFSLVGATMKIISRSSAMDMPKNFPASSAPVERVWTMVPPRAPADRAASMTLSV